MMQDFPRYFDASKVGFTTITGSGYAAEQGNEDLDAMISFYSPVKNNVVDAAAKQRKGQVPGCAACGEADLYKAHCKTLMAIGVQIALPTSSTYGEGDSAITVKVRLLASHIPPPVLLCRRVRSMPVLMVNCFITKKSVMYLAFKLAWQNLELCQCSLPI